MISEIIPSKVQGCKQIVLNRFEDKRGTFTKTFHEDIFKSADINMHVAEEYFTSSVKNVFRGMHFQIPPADHEKIVHCNIGVVTDFVVDLRTGSPTYGQYDAFELDGEKPKLIYIPKGLAHGFFVHSAMALMQYKVSTVYDLKCDTGLLYTSFDFSKDFRNTIVSDRDLGFSEFENFNSPFKF
jgi:dTDP-4-dehydrorhamnose 3,5-epimerase